MSSVGVEVHATVEDGSSVLSDGRRDEGLATRVVLDEVGHIMDDTSNSNESLAILGVLNKVVPANDGKLLEGRSPVELRTLLVELLLQLLNTALLNLVGTELLEVVGKAEPLPEGDGPLGGVILPPLNGISVVGGELVVEVVVSLTERDDGGDDVVTRGVAVVKRLVTQPVGKRVDAEGGLLDEANSENAAIYVTTEPVTPHESAEDGREDETHADDALDEVAVLPDYDGVLVEIGDIGAAGTLGILLEDHPA